MRDILQLLIGLLALCACATVREEQPSPLNDLEIALGAGWAEDRPTLVVTITNRSNAPICISADVLRNPESHELDLRLRDARGNRVSAYRVSGYIEPPLREIVRVEPGMSSRGQYYLDSRFGRIGRRLRLPNGWRAQALFQFGNCQPREAYCDGRIGLCPDAWSARAVSTWQPLSFTGRQQ